MAFKVMILGGSSEGRELAERLATDARFAPLLSFAGRTESIAAPRAPYRVGGFGGVLGLAAFLRAQGYAALIDATHAFARQMSCNAVAAAEFVQIPLLRLELPPWRAEPGDRWTLVGDMAAAAAALGTEPRRVFLSVGRLEIAAFAAAPEHEYLIRAVDPFEPGLPKARVLAARGPFDSAEERALLERERIEIVVSKNAGTPATLGKLTAARQLGLPVVMVQRPPLPAARSVQSFAQALDWLVALHGASLQRRGV
jgi:precorrin-6A/cobalt-precorrin-6A reductase